LVSAALSSTQQHSAALSSSTQQHSAASNKKLSSTQQHSAASNKKLSSTQQYPIKNLAAHKITLIPNKVQAKPVKV